MACDRNKLDRGSSSQRLWSEKGRERLEINKILKWLVEITESGFWPKQVTVV